MIDGTTKEQVVNIINEEYDTKNIKFKKEKNGENYKIYGLINNKYEYIYTITQDGYIVEHKDKNQCP